jgi:hypothetical protein
MWNPFKKNTGNNNNNDDEAKDSNKMGFVQRLAMKKVMNMSEEERMKMMKKVLTPENISKNKDKIMAVMEQMKANGQISQAQVEEAKKNLGI